MNVFVEAIVSLLILVGGAFILIGSIGLARLPDFFTRLHAPTKATTLGMGCLLVASIALLSYWQGSLNLHELLITLFLFITAPVTAHMLAKTALHYELEFTEKTVGKHLLEQARHRQSPVGQGKPGGIQEGKATAAEGLTKDAQTQKSEDPGNQSDSGN